VEVVKQGAEFISSVQTEKTASRCEQRIESMSQLFHSVFMEHFGSSAGLPDGVHILKPKIPIWVNFGKP
jgi:hypothetical protein